MKSFAHTLRSSKEGLPPLHPEPTPKIIKGSTNLLISPTQSGIEDQYYYSGDSNLMQQPTGHPYTTKNESRNDTSSRK